MSDGESVILKDIPFLPQRGVGADWSINDCGEACLAMVLNYALGLFLTVDEVAKKTKAARHMYSSVGGLMMALRTYVVKNEHKRPFSPDLIRKTIANGQPVIALVNYGVWPSRLKLVDFDGAHFVLIVGASAGKILVHDPLVNEPSWLTDRQLTAVMAKPPGCMGYQGVIVGRPCADAEYVDVKSSRLEFGSVEAQRYIAFGRQTAMKEAAAVHLVNFFDCIGVDAANIKGDVAAEMIIERLDSDLFDLMGDTDTQYEWRDAFLGVFKAKIRGYEAVKDE